MLAAWFQGSGERTAEDVVIKGARYNRKTGSWGEPFLMADTEGFPDINPVLFIDDRSTLWLVWYTVTAYQWESSILKYRTSSNYRQKSGAPVWDWQDIIHIKADGSTPDGINKNDRFVNTLERKYKELYDHLLSSGSIGNDGKHPVTDEMWNRALERYMSIARGTSFMADGIDITDSGEKIRTKVGYPVMRRIGWQTRNKPFQTGGKIMLPLYSDGFDFSLVAITADYGKTWQFSEPIVGPGSIQPALGKRKDETLVAFMRDNGPAPQRLMVSTSADNGSTWSLVTDTDIPNPGSAADMAVLKSGNWVLVSNDLEQGRHRLTVMLSDDEGKTWKYRKSIINGEPGSATRAHYPAIIQSSDGLIHITFTNQVPAGQNGGNMKNIAHAVFSEEWLMKK
jgi:predicted neuraminidase